MQKKYGKLTEEQFRSVADLLEHFQVIAKNFKEALKTIPEARLKEILTGDFSWSWVYELPFTLHAATATYALNLGDWLKVVAASPDPQQRVLDDTTPGAPLPSEGFHPDIEDHVGMGIVMSLVNTMNSLAMFGRSISGLVADVRDNDDLDSLFRAIKVDRTVITCPTIANRIARAEFQNDKKFFTRLSNSLKGPSQKEWAGLAKMKFSFVMLRELEIDNLSDDELEKLMVHTVGAYEDVPGARKNLRMHYLNSRKLKTI